MGQWMNKLEKIGSSAVTRMKTYIKKKEIEEDPMIDFHEDVAIDEEDNANAESTDISKNNSECSPPKEQPDDLRKEVEIDEITKNFSYNVDVQEQEEKYPELQHTDSELTSEA
jgi:hypothetical protein